MSEAAVAFAAELTVEPPDQAAADRAEAAAGTANAATDTAKTALGPPAGRRLPRAALLVGAAVVAAALIGGALLVVGAGDERPSVSMPGAVRLRGCAGTAVRGGVLGR